MHNNIVSISIQNTTQLIVFNLSTKSRHYRLDATHLNVTNNFILLNKQQHIESISIQILHNLLSLICQQSLGTTCCLDATHTNVTNNFILLNKQQHIPGTICYPDMVMHNNIESISIPILHNLLSLICQQSLGTTCCLDATHKCHE
jgi:hypothetical protein